MNINATIFVQIVHFLFAYYVLRHFLLRPVADIIFTERAYRKRLEDIIEHEEQVYIRKQEQQKEQWNTFQKEWQKNIPSLERYTKKEYPELDIQKKVLTQQELKQQANKIAQHIKESIEYAK